MATVYDQAAVRGKFYRPGDKVQLDERVYQYLASKAELRGVSLDDLVNDLLKKTIELTWKMEGH